MADTKAQNEAEFWIRRNALPAKFGQSFTKRSLLLKTGGEFSFDAVSEDRKIVAAISTSGGKTASGNVATAKLFKIRSDVLWFYMLEHPVARMLLVFTDQTMVDLIEGEKLKGRFPKEFEVVKVDLPPELASRILAAQKAAADEVTPNKKEQL